MDGVLGIGLCLASHHCSHLLWVKVVGDMLLSKCIGLENTKASFRHQETGAQASSVKLMKGDSMWVCAGCIDLVVSFGEESMASTKKVELVPGCFVVRFLHLPWSPQKIKGVISLNVAWAAFFRHTT